MRRPAQRILKSSAPYSIQDACFGSLLLEGQDLSMANPTVPPSPDTYESKFIARKRWPAESILDTTHGLPMFLLPKYEDIIIPEQSEYPPILWDFYTNITRPDALYDNVGDSHVFSSRAMLMEQNESSSPSPMQSIQPEYLEDCDTEGEPDPWYASFQFVNPPDNRLNGPSADFSDLPSIPRALYAYGVKRDTRLRE
ncbi:uncharacterized protein EI90DRAFT_3152406 [Cantharellus anzutake]|uniref:uncharacterized protein n=1 Tax=Cantharellus anzutake TaxID=1750568 RepID=UPI0019033FC5|nr:uncharacterized protein EI90DRAFT_3152406 [Cantharellus anzutake]KAF8337002.1 hypothetical protein EI90DRAFT_3152406 [Cantharellus anzutake]